MSGGLEPQTPPDSPSMDARVGKPPRHHLTSIRHCASSARIAAAAAAASPPDYVSTRSPATRLPRVISRFARKITRFLCVAGPGFGDAQLDLAHRRPDRVPARLPIGELR